MLWRVLFAVRMWVFLGGVSFANHVIWGGCSGGVGMKYWGVGPICGHILLGLDNRILTNRGNMNVSFSGIIRIYRGMGRYISVNIRITVIINNKGF